MKKALKTLKQKVGLKCSKDGLKSLKAELKRSKDGLKALKDGYD